MKNVMIISEAGAWSPAVVLRQLDTTTVTDVFIVQKPSGQKQIVHRSHIVLSPSHPRA
jgi:hypothetical protein